MYRESYPEDVNLNNVSFNDYLHLLEVSNKIRSLNLQNFEFTNQNNNIKFQFYLHGDSDASRIFTMRGESQLPNNAVLKIILPSKVIQTQFHTSYLSEGSTSPYFGTKTFSNKNNRPYELKIIIERGEKILVRGEVKFPSNTKPGRYSLTLMQIHELKKFGQLNFLFVKKN